MRPAKGRAGREMRPAKGREGTGMKSVTV